MVKWNEVAENELTSGNDIILEKEKYVGRNKARFVWKPVLGWRAKEQYQVSSKVGAAWRWVQGHLAEGVNLIWSRRRTKGVMELGGWEREEVHKYQQQTRHLARLLCKIGERGARTLDQVGGAEAWGGRWGWLAGMAEVVAGGGDADVAVLALWAAEARVRAEGDEKACREERRNGWIKFARQSVKGGGRKHTAG